MLFLLPLFAAMPSPGASNFFGSKCGKEYVAATLAKGINDYAFKKNISHDQEIADLKNVISLQTLDVKTTPFGSDITNPAWVTSMSMHVAMTYCNTTDTALLSKFGEPIPEIPQGLPFGNITVDTISDFPQLQGPLLNKFANSTDGRFVISVSDAQKLIVLSWRGSVVMRDFIADVEGTPLNLTDPLMSPVLDTSAVTNPKCKVPADTTGMYMFSGFAKTMQTEVMTNFVLPKLRDAQTKYPGYSIVINGHSLGAAKSFISAFHIAKFYPDINLKAVYTIEQPLVGSTKLATWMADCIGPEKYVRVVSSTDVVPWMRFDDDVQHPATVLETFNVDSNSNQFRNCQGTLDLNCSAQYSCLQRSWTFHSHISGLQFGPICHYIGLTPKK